jgi:hypothetical protein
MANGRKTQAPVSERRTRPLCEPRPRDCDSARRRIRSIRGRAAHASRRLTASRFWDTHAVDIPDVRYARAGSVAIAFQVVGEGPRTLLYSPPLSDLYSIWAAPSTRPFLDRLASELRLVVFNPRGTGFSDRPRDISLEARMDDILAILDILEIERVSLLGNWVGANTCALFAASYPRALRAPRPTTLRPARNHDARLPVRGKRRVVARVDSRGARASR